MKILNSLCIIFCFFFGSAVMEVFSGEAFHYDCIEEAPPTPEKLEAYIGWPYALDCSMFLDTEDYSVYELYDDDSFGDDTEVVCEIRSTSGDLLLNSTTIFEDLQYNAEKLILSDLSEDDDVKFSITMTVPSLSKCFNMDIQLQLIEFEQQTCQDFTKDSSLRTVASVVGFPKLFSCEVPSNVYPKVAPSREDNELTFTWTRNCSRLPKGISVIDNNERLRIPSLTFDQAGAYTCAVTYKGMTRYVMSTSVCVKHGLTFARPTFACQQEEYYQTIGDDVTILCVANFGTGSVSQTSFYITWLSHTANGASRRIRCENHSLLSKLSQSNSYCTFKLPAKECYSNLPSAEERIPKAALVDVKLHIKNFKVSDFGSYEAVVSTNFEGIAPLRTNVTVYDQGQVNYFILSSGEIIGLAVAITAFSLIVASMIIAFCIHFQNSNKMYSVRA